MEVILRNLVDSDRSYFFSWVKDKEVIKYSRSIFQRIKTDEEISRWFDSILKDNTSYNKAIIDKSTGILIGYAGIANLNETNLSGEYFIFIGNKAYHGKGIGTIVTKKIVEFGFSELKLNRIMLTVSEENTWAIRAYAKAGFKTEGIMRQGFCRNGSFHDKVIMSILRDEWTEMKNDVVKIRLVNIEDEDKVSILISQFRMELKKLKNIEITPNIEKSKEEFKEYLEKNYPIFVAEDYYKNVLGYIVCRIEEGVVWAESLFVLEEARRQGIAYKLYEKAENVAKGFGKDMVYSFVHPNNDKIINFLAKKGYDVLNLIEIRKPFKNEMFNGKIQVGNYKYNY